MNDNGRKPKQALQVSEKTLQKAAARLLADHGRLVTPEIHYLQRVLGTAATQKEIDDNVVAVRKLPWMSIAPAD